MRYGKYIQTKRSEIFMLIIFCLSKHTYRIYNPISPLNYIAAIIKEIIKERIKITAII